MPAYFVRHKVSQWWNLIRSTLRPSSGGRGWKVGDRGRGVWEDHSQSYHRNNLVLRNIFVCHRIIVEYFLTEGRGGNNVLIFFSPITPYMRGIPFISWRNWIPFPLRYFGNSLCQKMSSIFNHIRYVNEVELITVLRCFFSPLHISTYLCNRYWKFNHLLYLL